MDNVGCYGTRLTNGGSARPGAVADVTVTPGAVADVTVTPGGAADVTVSPGGAADVTVLPEGAADVTVSPVAGVDVTVRLWLSHIVGRRTPQASYSIGSVTSISKPLGTSVPGGIIGTTYLQYIEDNITLITKNTFSHAGMVFPHAIPHRRCALRTPRAHTHALMLWACAIGSDVRRTWQTPDLTL